MQSKKFKFGSTILDVLLIILAVFLLIFLLYRLIKSTRSIQESENLNRDPEELDDLDRGQNENNPIPKFFAEVVSAVPDMDENLKQYITAQAMHETGIFTSPLFLKYNNAFGMKQPVQRNTLSKGITESGYASYESVEDSIKDLQLWLDAKQAPETFESVESYIDYIKSKGYFEATLKSYKNAVVKHLNNVKPFAQ